MGEMAEADAQKRALHLFRRAIWQNDANRCALAEGAFSFDPAAVELSDVLDNG